MSVRIEINETAIAEMFRDWDSPVGEIISAATDVVERAAKRGAPVSPIGSEYAPIGFLKASTVSAADVHHDDQGLVLGLVGTHTNRNGGGFPYPLSFIFNYEFKTRNPGYYSRKRHQLTGRPPTYRPADNRYIQRALYALLGWTYHTH